MENKLQDLGDNEIKLSTPNEAPFRFNITITEGKTADSSNLTFEAALIDSKTGSIKIDSIYHLQNRGHNSYLDLFHHLAKSFGCRVPRNRQEPEKPKFTATYKVLVDKNLSEEILYGYGDPAVLRVFEKVKGEEILWYYIVVTSNDAPNSFPILRSKDLLNWNLAGFVFPEGKKPEWAAEGESVSDYWAPEMHRVGSEFRVYFTAREKETRKLSIGIAKSSHPSGSFIAEKKPIKNNNVIDPHVFVEDDNTTFLYWKEDNNDVFPWLLCQLLYEHPYLITELFKEDKENQITAALTATMFPWTQKLAPMERFFVLQTLIEAVISDFSTCKQRLKYLADGTADRSVKLKIFELLQLMSTPVYAQQLSPDGSRLIGEPKKVIENDQLWEAHLIEGMWVTKQQGKYYLFYSGNDFSTTQYGIGVAIADSPLGPYKKMPEPLLRSTAEWSAPGHPSIATGPDGETYIFFHAYKPGQAGYKKFRSLLSALLVFEKDKVLLK